MNRMLMAACSSVLLLSNGAAFPQAGGTVSASGSMGMRDSGKASDAMASGAMGVKQHISKHRRNALDNAGAWRRRDSGLTMPAPDVAMPDSTPIAAALRVIDVDRR